jgi:hypothetical protein
MTIAVKLVERACGLPGAYAVGHGPGHGHGRDPAQPRARSSSYLPPIYRAISLRGADNVPYDGMIRDGHLLHQLLNNRSLLSRQPERQIEGQAPRARP